MPVQQMFVHAFDAPLRSCSPQIVECLMNVFAWSGVKTMIQILSANDEDSEEEAIGKEHPEEARQDAPVLSRLGVQRLVLQPMDARLEYMRDLRVWLREHGWQISQVGGA